MKSDPRRLTFKRIPLIRGYLNINRLEYFTSKLLDDLFGNLKQYFLKSAYLEASTTYRRHIHNNKDILRYRYELDTIKMQPYIGSYLYRFYTSPLAYGSNMVVNVSLMCL